MRNNLTAKASIDINAPVSKVWEALTNPSMIKKYLFGTDTITDWKVGSPITFQGQWEGKSYQDKGTILANEKEKLLSYSYWSSMSSLPDLPENYANVAFQLQPKAGVTNLSLTQDNCPTEESRKHSEDNWNMVLKSIKELVEH